MEVVVAVVLIVGTNLVVELGELFRSLHVGGALLHIMNPLHVHERIEEAEVAVHLGEFLLVGVLLAGVPSQERVAIAHGDNLGRSLAHLPVCLQRLQHFGESHRTGSPIAEQALDEQALEGLHHTLALLVAIHVFVALAESLQYLVAHF